MPSEELLDDLCTRFILNVPAEDLQSFEKFMFLVEQAHWYYEDFCRDNDPSLKSLSLRTFTGIIFQHCPGLAQLYKDRDSIYARFSAYKQTVPVMGAILLNTNMDKCLLVRGFKNSASWGFPKGKVAKDEADAACAIREVREETGLDISDMLVEEECIERHIKQQRSKLYIITGVEETTEFEPQVRGEIGAFGWHYVTSLPASEEAAMQYNTAEGARHHFYQVAPYVSQLRRFVKKKKAQAKKKKPDAKRPEVHHAPNNGEAVQVASTANIKAVPAAGQAWLNFKFDTAAIMQHLAF
ncbi:g10311 [Coccomyxa elongata]